MQDNPNPSQDAAPDTQPVIESPPEQELSSLARYRAAQQASAPVATDAQNAGQPTPESGRNDTGQTRSEYIPRDRFDQVNQAKSAAEAELAQLRQQYAQPQQPVVQQYQAPQQLTMGGMVQPQAPQQLPQPMAAPDFSNAAVKREWQDKIANNPIDGLKEFVSLLIQSEGAPMLQQFQQQVMGRLEPIQRNYVGQQINSYTSTRASDPSWAQIKPTFDALAQQAISQGYTPTPDVLAVVESVARQQMGVPMFSSAPQTQAPFTERPGSGGANFGKSQHPALTPQERGIAKQFGMTEAEYAAQKATYRRG